MQMLFHVRFFVITFSSAIAVLIQHRQALVSAEISSVLMVIGLVIGLVLILYGQFKYNRGIF